MATRLVFTHTLWAEAPRLRHQVTRLLLDQGHEVVFFERAAPLWSSAGSSAADERGLRLIRPRKLLHHQFRLIPPLDWLNAKILVRSMEQALQSVDLAGVDRIVNFAHDAYFLRDMFPEKRLVTIINDDWEAQGRLPYRGHITRALRRTCMVSDRVLTVSVPLQRRLRDWCDPELFLPWAVDPYRRPNTGAPRDTLLYWGYLDRTFDEARTAALATHLQATRPDWRILLVGPSQWPRRRAEIAARLAAHTNVEMHAATPLDALPLERVIAGLMPYCATPAVAAVTLANKSLRLLAHGLPLLIAGMPEFIRRPFILRLDDADGMESALRACEINFAVWQPAIQEFVSQHSPQQRLAVLDA